MTSTVRSYIPISKNLDGRFEVNLTAMNLCLMFFGNLDISTSPRYPMKTLLVGPDCWIP